MTMTSTTSASPQRASVSLRKTNKPLMEKRRRARINDSLSQLKSLVIQGSKKDSSQFNKLEKADILELTVKHLRNLQDQQLQQQQQQLLSQTNDSSLTGKYQAGFMECANEVIRYLGQSQGFSDDIKTRVIRHLASCIQLSSKVSFSKSPMQANTTPSNTPVLAAGLQTTNAQLSNGQVIQIVKSPFQNSKVSSTGQHVQPITIAPAVSSVPMSSVPIQIPVAISSNTASLTSSSSSEPAHFIKCTQPLHIQIPPVLSPVVIQTKSMQHQNPPPQPHKTQDPLPQVVQSHLYNVQQETLVTSTSPSPQLREMYIPSPPSKTNKKAHTYYSLDDHYSDFIPRSRTYSFTSSASSESELNSPLNLSQSPQYYERRDNDNFSTSMDSHQFETSNKRSQYFIKNSPSSSSSSLYHPSSNFASVIVDGRKAVDGHALTKYMHIIDEDRIFLRSDRSSSSPASSVCEERLWRPW